MDKPIGKITHFYDRISVAVLELDAELKVGDKIKISGHDHEVEQMVDSMQVEHQNIQAAKKGQAIGLKVSEPVKEGDQVYKVE